MWLDHFTIGSHRRDANIHEVYVVKGFTIDKSVDLDLIQLIIVFKTSRLPSLRLQGIWFPVH